MTIDLRTVRAVLLLVAAILFFAGAGLGIEHERKLLIVWGVGFGLVTLERLLVVAIETFWRERRARARPRPHGPVGEASVGPGLGGLDQAPAEHVELVLVVGQVLGRDLDAHLVQRRLGLLADLVAFLGHDRHLAHLGQE